MASIRILAPSRKELDAGLLIGRLDGPGTGSLETPVRVGLLECGAAWAAPRKDTVDSEWKPGKVTDVKPSLHWVLEPTSRGGALQLRPVHGWYEFAKTPHLGGGGKASGRGAAAAAASTAGTAGAEETLLKEQAKLRHQQADRWEAIAQKRDKRADAVAAAKVGQAMADVERRKAEVLYPDKAYLNDEAGHKRQQQKRRKLQQKMQGEAEDEDAPDTANAMHKLKRDGGEAGWDFSDEEQFSDDEENRDQYDGLGAAADGADEEEAPPVDEDAEEPEEGGAAAALSGHGAELEVLMEEDRKGTLAVDLADGAEGQSPPASSPAEEASPLSTGVGAVPGAPGATPASATPSPEVPSPASRRAVDVGKGASPSKVPHPPSATKPLTEDLRQKVIDCLLSNSGSCSGSALITSTRVSRNSPAYPQLLAIIREVAEVKVVAGERMVVLRPGLQGVARS